MVKQVLGHNPNAIRNPDRRAAIMVKGSSQAHFDAEDFEHQAALCSWGTLFFRTPRSSSTV
jgi:hypothetical protein